MTRGELINWITECLKDYKKQGIMESVKRNNHMNKYDGQKIKQKNIDAILVDFVNFLAMKQGLDLGLYTKDI